MSEHSAETVCTCGCPSEAHIGEIGCACALPGDPPCTPDSEVTTEWNVLDDGIPYLQPWTEDEDDARSYSNVVTGPLVRRTRTRYLDQVSPWSEPNTSPDLLDAMGRRWSWKSGDLYRCEGMAWPRDLLPEPVTSLPTSAPSSDPRPALAQRPPRRDPRRGPALPRPARAQGPLQAQPELAEDALRRARGLRPSGGHRLAVGSPLAVGPLASRDLSGVAADDDVAAADGGDSATGVADHHVGVAAEVEQHGDAVTASGEGLSDGLGVHVEHSTIVAVDPSTDSANNFLTRSQGLSPETLTPTERPGGQS